ncbi:MAG: HAD-IIIA family hydrolase [Thaumarchaeota archaeon]|nr:HAD-IIIA family hydrolase [Nitrososphaerota archaeon]MBI3641334.1 HAD-IIIA family hydrolase [Nitrososphaerota archaeon]
MNAKLLEKCKKIKVVLTDVDGVLTDGGMYYTAKGDTMKKFHTSDGMGVTLLRKKNIPTIIVTKEKTIIVKRWAVKMKIEKLYDGILKKEEMVDIMCKKYRISPDEIAYIGDDINDVELLKRVGLSVVPHDAIKEAKKVSHYICRANGGAGAFREAVDLILSKHG